MEQKRIGENTLKPADFKREEKRCHYFLKTIYEDYKAL
jgi:hypothetical protein